MKEIMKYLTPKCERCKKQITCWGDLCETCEKKSHFYCEKCMQDINEEKSVRGF